MCHRDVAQVPGSSATSPGPPWAGGAFPALPSRENAPLVQRKQNKPRRLTESPCSSESVFTIMGAGLACEETKAECHRAEQWTQPFAVRCLCPGRAATGRRQQLRKGSALVPPAGAQQSWDRSRATAWLWASVPSSGLVCPQHHMASAAGKETGKTENTPSLGPESHQHQNLLEIHMTEGFGNRRSRAGSPSAGGLYPNGPALRPSRTFQQLLPPLPSTGPPSPRGVAAPGPSPRYPRGTPSARSLAPRVPLSCRAPPNPSPGPPRPGLPAAGRRGQGRGGAGPAPPAAGLGEAAAPGAGGGPAAPELSSAASS